MAIVTQNVTIDQFFDVARRPAPVVDAGAHAGNAGSTEPALDTGGARRAPEV